MESQELPFFFVFPDNEDVRQVAERAERYASGGRVVRSPAGRPWIVGRWDDREFLFARSGATALALFGTFDVDRGELARRASGAQGAAEVCATSGSWPGSFHLVASLDGGALVR